MNSHITNFVVLKDLYGTDEMRAVFDETHLVQKWLDVEVALAQAEAELGVIPQAAADEIARAGRAENIDLGRMKQGVDHTLHPIVPLIRLFQEVCAGNAGEYIHWGATTQDIMDTGVVLQLKEATEIFERRLHELESGVGGAVCGAPRRHHARPHAWAARAANHLWL